MGQKSRRAGNNFSHCLAAGCIIAAVTLAGCSPLQNKFAEIGAQHKLNQYRENLADGFFETVIEESLQIIEQNESKPPADTAFYALGEVYAHHDYDGRDYYLSQYYFKKLIANFPDSALTSEAKTYLSLIESINALEEEAAKEKEPAAILQPLSVGTEKNFLLAAQRNLQIVKEAGNEKPADEALYNLGLIYAHVDNPAKDFKKSQSYFRILTTQFPDSEYTDESEVILGLFETINKIQQIDVDIEQQKKQLIR